MSHHDYGESFRSGPTGDDFQSGSSYSEQADSDLNPTLVVSFDSMLNKLSNTNPTAQCPTPVQYDPFYYLLVQQQQTHPSYQQLSEARCHSGQTHDGSYNSASPSSNSAGQSMYTPAASSPQYQSTANSACPSIDSTPRGPVPTVAATSTQCQQPMGMSHASLDRATLGSRGATQLPNACVPTAPSPVLHDVPSKAAGPTIKKKHKRADARQISALNEMYVRTAFPSTEERQQLAKDLDMSARSVQIWFKNKRQASRQGGRNPPNRPLNQVTVTPPPLASAPLAFLVVLAVLAAAFVVARA